jgi:hypothetical protein
MISAMLVTMTMALTSAMTSRCPAGWSVIAPEALIQTGTALPFFVRARTKTWPERADPSGAVQRAGAQVS